MNVVCVHSEMSPFVFSGLVSGHLTTLTEIKRQRKLEVILER